MIMLRIIFILNILNRYKCDINITELITLEDAMNEFTLGPNGGNFILFSIKNRSIILHGVFVKKHSLAF